MGSGCIIKTCQLLFEVAVQQGYRAQPSISGMASSEGFVVWTPLRQLDLQNSANQERLYTWLQDI